MNDIFINRNIPETENIYSEDVYVENATYPAYPGAPLYPGSRGSNVSIIQSYLNAIGQSMFPSITKLSVDGIYGNSTTETVRQYQGFSGLEIDGITGMNTWNSIVEDYNSLPDTPSDRYPGYILQPGTSGVHVRNIQLKLNRLNTVYPAINYQQTDGLYGNNMSAAVRRFQGQFGLAADGIVGPLTWDKIVSVHTGVTSGTNTAVTAAYPGRILTAGSSGDSVRFMQSYLNTISRHHNLSLPVLNTDGIYGRQTKKAVYDFQAKYGLKADGITGPETWNRIIKEFNAIL